MKNKKVVITGGPATGKTSIIDFLEASGAICYSEISRTIIQEAQKKGIEQLFLKDPYAFSQKLLEGRIQQFKNAETSEHSTIFLDRGIPDVIAYMEYAKENVPPYFKEACKTYKYDVVFILPPWKAIHKTDEERYENFEQAQQIHAHLLKTYTQLGYPCIEVPIGSIEERSLFIKNRMQDI